MMQNRVFRGKGGQASGRVVAGRRLAVGERRRQQTRLRPWWQLCLPKCGHKEPHVAGQRCIDRTCPKCGTRMIRE